MVKYSDQSLITGLYAITDTNLLPNKITLVQKAEQALKSGINVLQYRNKTNDFKVMYDEARALIELCRDYKVPFIINDNLQLAVACNADGIHLGQHDHDVLLARKLLGNTKIIGATCHSSITQAQHAAAQGANYVAFGRFYPSHTKPNAPSANLTVLRKAKKTLSIPIVAIGGINAANIAQVFAMGADAAAVIYAIFAEENVAAAVLQLKTYCPQ